MASPTDNGQNNSSNNNNSRRAGGSYQSFGGGGGGAKSGGGGRAGGSYQSFGGGSGSPTSGGASVGGGAGRPWAEVIAFGGFGKPESVGDAVRRIKKNLFYFRRNYAVALLVLVGLSLLWRPISLVVLAILLAAWIYLYFSRSGPLVLFNTSVGENVVLPVLSVVTVVALAFTPHAGTSLLVSLLLGIALVFLHAAFRRPDDLFLDEQEQQALLGTSGNVVVSARV